MNEYYMIMLDRNKRIPMVFEFKGLEMAPLFPTQAQASAFAMAYAYEQFFIREAEAKIK